MTSPRKSDEPRVALLHSARFSDNLGDGVIGDSLAYMLKQIRPAWRLVHVDIAGRTEFEPRSAGSLSATKRVFYALPAPLRGYATLAAWPFLHRRRVVSAWCRTRPGPGYFAIFAGGQIISDTALNFPLKFGLASRLIAADKAPAAVFAVGVSSSYSSVGRRMYQNAFARLDLRYFGVRDATSLRNLADNFTIPHCIPRKTIDPAVWSADAYALKRKVNSGPIVGIGLAHPVELGTHLAGSERRTTDDMLPFFESLVTGLRARGVTPLLFNNGSAEDQLFMDHVVGRISAAHGRIFEISKRPILPADLVGTISGCDAVIAHRLHANIIAFSLGIPSIGMKWDSKVEAFFREIGHPDRCVASSTDAESVIALAEKALNGPADPQRLHELKTFAMAELNLLVEALET